ncbi:MAG: 4Fe-4S ferredoxin, partial [Planctomycetota bacterium]
MSHRPQTPTAELAPLTAEELRTLALEAGADDAGVVEIGRAALDDQREDLEHFYPWAKSLLSIVVRMNREPLRSTARSLAN